MRLRGTPRFYIRAVLVYLTVPESALISYSIILDHPCASPPSLPTDKAAGGDRGYGMAPQAHHRCGRAEARGGWAGVHVVAVLLDEVAQLLQLLLRP